MLASFFPWVLTLCALISTMYYAGCFWEDFLKFTVLFNGGIQGLWAAVGHLLFPERVAKAIGWKTSGFQTEIGATNLAIGITSLLSFLHPEWLTPIALIIAIFYAGCVYVHIKERLFKENDSPLNSGPILYNTIFVMIILVIGLILELNSSLISTEPLLHQLVTVS
jgi:hypothetical protein